MRDYDDALEEQRRARAERDRRRARLRFDGNVVFVGPPVRRRKAAAKPKPKPRAKAEPRVETQADRRPGVDWAVVDSWRDCCAANFDVLNPWEQTFIANISTTERFRDWLSDKQLEALERTHNRVHKRLDDMAKEETAFEKEQQTP